MYNNCGRSDRWRLGAGGLTTGADRLRAGLGGVGSDGQTKITMSPDLAKTCRHQFWTMQCAKILLLVKYNMGNGHNHELKNTLSPKTYSEILHNNIECCRWSPTKVICGVLEQQVLCGGRALPARPAVRHGLFSGKFPLGWSAWILACRVISPT